MARCRSYDKIYLKGFCFPNVVKLLQQIPCTVSCSQKLRWWEGIWAIAALPWPDLSEMFFLPADPSFSLNKSHSAKQVAIKTSPFPQSRLVYRLNLTVTEKLLLSEVPQHNLLVSVVLHLCWSAEFSWIDASVATHHSIQECMWKFVVFQREVLRKRAVLLYLFYDLLKTNQTDKKQSTKKNPKAC